MEEKDGFDDYCRQLQGISDRMREERIRQRGDQRGSYNRQRDDVRTFAPTVPVLPAAPRPDASNTMDWEPTLAARGQSTPARRAKWVNNDEIQRRRENGRCLRCGGSGHRIAQCPFAPARTPRARAALIDVQDALPEDSENEPEQGKE